MKSMKVFSALLVASIPVLAQGQAPVQKRGTDILHYAVRESVVAETGFAIEGRAYLTRKEQGNSEKQTADIYLRQLEANGSYLVFALTGDDPEYTYVNGFDADSRGRANLRFRSHGNGQSLGRGKLPLPDLFNPTTAIKELLITTAQTQAVARVQFAAPDKMSYLVKRYLDTAEVQSLLRLKANHRQARLKWVIGGLVAATEYRLVLNGVAAETMASDAEGQLVIDRVFEDPYEALHLESIYLNDLTDTHVVGTELP